MATTEATKDWTPPTGEFRPSSLGACARYAWEEIRRPQEDRVLGPIGREVMLYTGHAAEEKWIELARLIEGRLLLHGQTLHNGFNGTCHPDAVDYSTRTIYEIKFSGYSKPAPYHVAQIQWYLHRMSQETGGAEWTGCVVLLSKYGKDPGYFEIEFPDADRIAELTARAESHLAAVPPTGICTNRTEATTKARYYDKETPCGQRTEICCPYADVCHPPTDDDFGV